MKDKLKLNNNKDLEKEGVEIINDIDTSEESPILDKGIVSLPDSDEVDNLSEFGLDDEPDDDVDDIDFDVDDVDLT